MQNLTDFDFSLTYFTFFSTLYSLYIPLYYVNKVSCQIQFRLLCKVVESLEKAAENKLWLTVADFEADILREDTEIDFALITACRVLTSQFLQVSMRAVCTVQDST